MWQFRTIARFGIALLAAAMIPAAIAAASDLRVVERGTQHIVQLSQPARDAITRYDATFQVWRDEDYLPIIRESYEYGEHQAPFAIIADFNADGALDVVLDGRTSTSPIVLALLSRRGTYDPVVVSAGLGSLRAHEQWYETGGGRQFGRWVFLRRRVGPGRVRSPFTAQEIVLRGDAFEIAWWEKAATLFYYEDRSFKEMLIAD